MNIWIITTGSRDVQLTTNDLWHDWYCDGSSVKTNCENLPFKPTQILEDSDEPYPYRIAPRVLGKVYQAQPEEVWQYLEFPLLSQFTTQLQCKKITKIYLLVTDQTEKYNEEREDIRCPYWQDTCELQSIIESYFQKQKEFLDVDLIPIPLSPEKNKPGLDDWNHVLKIVRTAFSEEIKVEPDTVYVSHQAGTPAISSAVQFMSLARFGERVEFLVSNEYEKEPLEPIKSSEYLRGIKFQEANALLKHHDYAGVKELVGSYLNAESVILLDAAIQWNFAKFEDEDTKSEDFVKKLLQYPNEKFVQEVEERTKKENWWWTAYESAYLAVVRLKQGNTVEAMFHSFRAVEGLLRQWVDKFYSEEINQTKHPSWNKNERWNRNLNKYGQDLYLFLSIKKTIDREKNSDIWIFGNQVFNKRNDLFHQLKGLQDKKAVFENWRSPNEKQWRDDAEKKWKARILGCLNFIAEPKPLFISLEEASLMSKVHKELEKAIAQYELKP